MEHAYLSPSSRIHDHRRIYDRACLSLQRAYLATRCVCACVSVCLVRLGCTSSKRSNVVEVRTVYGWLASRGLSYWLFRGMVMVMSYTYPAMGEGGRTSSVVMPALQQKLQSVVDRLSFQRVKASLSQNTRCGTTAVAGWQVFLESSMKGVYMTLC